MMEPRIGSVKVEQQVYSIDENGTPTYEAQALDYQEVDFAKDKYSAKLFSSVYGPTVRGVYTTSDSSDLQLSWIGAKVGQY